MRHFLPLLAAIGALTLGFQAHAAAVDIVSVNFRGHFGCTLVNAGTVLLGSDRSIQVVAPTTMLAGETLHWIDPSDPMFLPSGLHGISSALGNRLEMVNLYDWDRGPEVFDSAVVGLLNANWTVRVNGVNRTVGIPASAIVAPSARTHAELTAASLQRLHAYSGSGTLLVEIEHDPALTGPVRVGMFGLDSNSLRMLGQIGVGSHSIEVTPGALASDESLVLVHEGAKQQIAWPSGSGLTGSYWESNISVYIVPTPGAAIHAAIDSVSIRHRDAEGNISRPEEMGIAVFGSGAGWTATGPGEPDPLNPVDFPPNVLPGGFDQVVGWTGPTGFTAEQYDAAMAQHLLGTWTLSNDAGFATGAVPASVYSPFVNREHAEFTAGTLSDFIDKATNGFSGSMSFALKAACSNAVSVGITAWLDTNQGQNFSIAGSIPAGQLSATFEVNLPAGQSYNLAAIIHTGGTALDFCDGADVRYWQTSATAYEDLVVATPCFGDMDANGTVDTGDVAILLLDFGPCSGCSSDLDGTGEVDTGDAALLLLNFGPCT